MKNKRKISMFLAFILIFTVVFPSQVFAAAKNVTKEYIFTTGDKDLSKASYTDNQEIKIDGKKYKAIKTEYKIVNTKKKITKKVTYKNLIKKEVPETIKKNGETLTLEGSKWTTNRRNPATGTLTYTGRDSKPDAPKTTDINATLPDGSVITVTGDLTGVSQSAGAYTKPFTVTGKFTGDADVAYYMLGDVRWPNNTKSPAFEGYETAILNALGLGDGYKITSAKWNGDYKIENGQTVRYATFSGVRQSSDWVAHYTERMTDNSPSLNTYTAVATYSNMETDLYEVAAIVAYEKVGLSMLQIIAIGAGIILAIAAIVLILFVLKKKKKEATNS
ncbi:hypothetical protein M2140_001780 [Clostridiales Family XIII bacterium PM5-7]